MLNSKNYNRIEKVKKMLRELYEARGLNRHNVAIKSDTSDQFLRNCEDFTQRLTWRVAQKVAQVLDMDPSELFLQHCIKDLQNSAEYASKDDGVRAVRRLSDYLSDLKYNATSMNSWKRSQMIGIIRGALKETGVLDLSFGNRDSYGRKIVKSKEKENSRAVKEEEENDRDSFGRKKPRDQLGYRKKEEAERISSKSDDDGITVGELGVDELLAKLRASKKRHDEND